MQLEDYFEFEKFNTTFGPVERIRIRGHRIAIEHVIEAFNNGVPADTIVREYYPTLSLEQVHATITFYLHNRARLDEYIRHGEEIGDLHYQEHMQKEPPPAIKRLRALKAQRQSEENLKTNA